MHEFKELAKERATVLVWSCISLTTACHFIVEQQKVVDACGQAGR
jgi:hypothetical protein